MNTRWLVILSLFGLAPNALARPEKPPTVREAQQTLRMPRGSLSLGLTNKGTLRHGVALPVKGRGFAEHEVHIRMMLGKRIRLRLTPEVRFYYDNTLVEGMRMSNLVSEVVNQDKRKQQDSGRDEDLSGDDS